MLHELSLFFPKGGVVQVKMVWDAKLRRYVEEGTVPELREKTLEDYGTRYEHLADLKDVWQSGIETITRIKSEYRSVGDELLMKNLALAIELVERQLDLMSKFDLKQYDLRKMVADLPEVPAGEYEKTLPKLLNEDAPNPPEANQ